MTTDNLARVRAALLESTESLERLEQAPDAESYIALVVELAKELGHEIAPEEVREAIAEKARTQIAEIGEEPAAIEGSIARWQQAQQIGSRIAKAW